MCSVHAFPRAPLHTQPTAPASAMTIGVMKVPSWNVNAPESPETERISSSSGTARKWESVGSLKSLESMGLKSLVPAAPDGQSPLAHLVVAQGSTATTAIWRSNHRRQVKTVHGSWLGVKYSQSHRRVPV